MPNVNGENSDGASRSRGRNRRGYRRGRSNTTRQNTNSRVLENLSTQTYSMSASGRSFGGQLSRPNGLHADAPEFRPGQPLAQRSRGETSTGAALVFNHSNQSRQRRPSRSGAPDIAGRIHEDIFNNIYECAICTNDVLRTSRIWSCRTCFTVFHLSCIKRWANNEASSAEPSGQPQIGTITTRLWRCPGCNLPKDILPNDYRCWCAKETDPRVIPGLHPHSCGQTCAKARSPLNGCPHPCELTCHAGPCPPCNRIGQTLDCFCGRKSKTERCVETDYNSGWSCSEPCSKRMDCKLHNCGRACHDGPCGSCSVQVGATCFCGQSSLTIACHEKGPERESQEHGAKAEFWLGSFACSNLCQRLFSCGVHRCAKPCHSQEYEPSECPSSPAAVKTCHCGKTKLSQILSTPRQTCQDEIPKCSKTCEKSLECGHLCVSNCHAGRCPTCTQRVQIFCRCGRTGATSVCHQGQLAQPQCTRVCKATMNCNRHECGEHCCTGERRAVERNTIKKKPRAIGTVPRPMAEEEFEAEHICTRVCGKPLKCGSHPCPDLCHRNACRSCQEAVFDDLSCHCGRTIVQAPVPCGTKPPTCHYQCERSKSCGHPQVPHPCHQDEEACPRCPFLTEKPCACGRKALKSIPCSLSDPRCGMVCGKQLACSNHLCRLPCHRPGSCEDSNQKCAQICGKEKKTCSHPCRQPCHGSSECLEEKPCSQKIQVTCSCQHIKELVACLATSSSSGNKEKILKCTEACKELARKHQLAEALGVDIEGHTNNHVPYSVETLGIYISNSTWAATQEKIMREFAANPEEKRLRFKPMVESKKRSFLHLLAEDFGLDAESMDTVPHRHVVMYKTPRFVSAPLKTLKECAIIRKSDIQQEKMEESAALRERENARRFNALVLNHPSFGLTTDELLAKLDTATVLPRGMRWNVEFSQSEDGEVILKLETAIPGTKVTEPNLEATLRSIKGDLTLAAPKNHLAESVTLARVDVDLHVQKREDEGKANGIWSTVAAKGSNKGTKLASHVSRATKNPFMVLGSRKMAAVENETVDADWEQAAREEDHATQD